MIVRASVLRCVGSTADACLSGPVNFQYPHMTRRVRWLGPQSAREILPTLVKFPSYLAFGKVAIVIQGSDYDKANLYPKEQAFRANCELNKTR